MGTQLKWFTHSTGSAPQLSNSQGALIPILDACLVTGFNERDIISATKSGDMITLDFGVNHGYLNYQVIELSGFSDSKLNGEHRILLSTTTTITFELSNVISLIGSGKCKLAPLGFEKKYEAFGKRAYRSKNTLINPFYLRVDDTLDLVWTSTYAKFAKVAIVEDMSGIELSDIAGYQAPYDASNPNQNWVGSGSGSTAVNGWAKWYYAYALGFSSSYQDVTAPAVGNYQWLIVGDESGFYFLPSSYTDASGTVYAFGMFESYLNNDNFNCFLNATFNRGAANSSSYKDASTGMLKTTISNTIVLRNKTQTANYAIVGTIGIGVATSVATGSQDILTPINQAQFSEVYFNEGNFIRGKPNNFYWLYNKTPYTNLTPFIQDGSIYMARSVASNSNILGQVVLKIGEL